MSDQLPKKHSRKAKELNQARLLSELAIDFDWGAAAKRSGISTVQLAAYKSDPSFMALAEKIVGKTLSDRLSVDDSIDKFLETQKKLTIALDDGELSVSASLLKSHEMEFKMHGLFEKDNRQKGSNVSINITFDNPNAKGSLKIEDEAIDGERLQEGT